MSKQYDKEFKIQTVRMIQEQGKSVAQAARELGIAENTLYRWVSEYKQDPVNAFRGSGNLKIEEKTVLELQKRIRQLEMENEILKKGDAHLRKRPELIFALFYKHRSKYPVSEMCRI